jgi:hypothetical protein
MPFGTGPYGRLRARAGDVAVWDDRGTVRHVAFVESGGLRPTILTNDGNESLYRMNLALLGNEPLRAHGDLEFWKLDPNKVRISVVTGKDCGT